MPPIILGMFIIFMAYISSLASLVFVKVVRIEYGKYKTNKGVAKEKTDSDKSKQKTEIPNDKREIDKSTNKISKVYYIVKNTKRKRPAKTTPARKNLDIAIKELIIPNENIEKVNANEIIIE